MHVTLYLKVFDKLRTCLSLSVWSRVLVIRRELRQLLLTTPRVTSLRAETNNTIVSNLGWCEQFQRKQNNYHIKPFRVVNCEQILKCSSVNGTKILHWWLSGRTIGRCTPCHTCLTYYDVLFFPKKDE